MDNDEIEKYKREVEQNQMREQGLLKSCSFLLSRLTISLHSALKKNALLDEIRKGIFSSSSRYSHLRFIH